MVIIYLVFILNYNLFSLKQAIKLTQFIKLYLNLYSSLAIKFILY